MTDDSSHLIIGIDSVDEAEYRLKYCTLSSFWYGKPLFPAPTNHENPFGTGKPCPAVRNRRPGYSKPRAAERFLMGWCRGGKVDGWARGKADGKAGAGARLTAGLTARQALAARLTAKQAPGLAASCSTQKHRRWLPAPAQQPQHKGGDRQDADKQADDNITCPHIGTGKTFNQVCVKILSATARINKQTLSVDSCRKRFGHLRVEADLVVDLFSKNHPYLQATTAGVSSTCRLRR